MMEDKSSVQLPGEKVKKALRWVSEVVRENPDKKRNEILKEAELRFDLSPADCEFLDKNFA